MDDWLGSFGNRLPMCDKSMKAPSVSSDQSFLLQILFDDNTIDEKMTRMVTNEMHTPHHVHGKNDLRYNIQLVPSESLTYINLSVEAMRG